MLPTRRLCVVVLPKYQQNQSTFHACMIRKGNLMSTMDRYVVLRIESTESNKYVA